MNAGVQSHAGAGTIAVVAREVGVTLRFGAKSHGLGKLVAQADSIYRAEVVQGATMSSILTFCCDVFGRLLPEAAWHIEVHQFRIEAKAGQQGSPTPEGNHRDGVSFVLVMMVQRNNIASGTTTIYDLAQRRLDSFTLTEPFDAAIVNDERCMHGVTPVVQLDPDRPAYRDVLVVTFRRR